MGEAPLPDKSLPDAPLADLPIPDKGIPDQSPPDQVVPDAGLPLPKTGLCSKDNWCWANPLPQGHHLYGIWGSAKDKVWAAGEKGTILTFDGKDWARVDSGTTYDLNAITGVGTTVCVAGDKGMIRCSAGGGSWGLYPAGITVNLEGIWAGGSVFVAVGRGGAVVRNTGSGFKTDTSGVTKDLYAVWGSNPTNIYAVGDAGTAIHFSGSGWKKLPSLPSAAATANLRAVWGSGGGDLVITGVAGAIFRYDGSKWTDMSVSSYAAFNALWGSSASDVHAVGSAGEVYHYSGGSSWTNGASQLKDELRAVWGSAKGDVHAVGDFGAMAHYDGNAWQARSSRVATHALRRIWGSSANAIFFVGDEGTALRFDGSTWHVMTTGTTHELYGVWGFGPTDVHAVGGQKVSGSKSKSIALHYNGLFNTWTSIGPTPSLSNWRMFAVWGAAKDDVHAIGNINYRMHHDGKGWTYGTLPSYAGHWYHYTDLWGSGSSNIYGVTETSPGNKILHYDGKIWTFKSIGSAAKCDHFSGVWGTSATNVFFVSSYKICVARYDGVTWHPVSTGLSSTSKPNKIWGSGPKNIYMVGSQGTVILSNGVTSQAQATGTTHDLHHVWGTSATNVYVVGENGAILHRGK